MTTSSHILLSHLGDCQQMVYCCVMTHRQLPHLSRGKVTENHRRKLDHYLSQEVFFTCGSLPVGGWTERQHFLTLLSDVQHFLTRSPCLTKTRRQPFLLLCRVFKQKLMLRLTHEVSSDDSERHSAGSKAGPTKRRYKNIKKTVNRVRVWWSSHTNTLSRPLLSLPQQRSWLGTLSATASCRALLCSQPAAHGSEIVCCQEGCQEERFAFWSNNYSGTRVSTHSWERGERRESVRKQHIGHKTVLWEEIKNKNICGLPTALTRRRRLKVVAGFQSKSWSQATLEGTVTPTVSI